jgi:Uncharacterized alpha/beta hydrolase domain (DUF2235)
VPHVTEGRQSTRAKRIVLCFDGTANQIGAGNLTNVAKIFEMVDKNDPASQLGYYDPGVGTLAPAAAHWAVPRTLSLLIEQAFGVGLKAAPFPPGYPDTTRTFYSPVDQVHDALKAVLTSADKSIVVAMYGYDDPELNAVLQSALKDENMYVQMSLDSTQTAGKAESALLARGSTAK